jgi:hypothetical protein
VKEFVNEDLRQILLFQQFCFEHDFALSNEAGGVDRLAFVQIRGEELAPVGG